MDGAIEVSPIGYIVSLTNLMQPFPHRARTAGRAVALAGTDRENLLSDKPLPPQSPPEGSPPDDRAADDAAAIADLLRPAILRLNRDLRREIRGGAGLSPFQTLILTTLQCEPGIGVNELAARERIRPPSMSAHVKGLEQAGYLERVAGAHADRRRVGLRITPEGARVVEEIRRLRTAWLATRIALLSGAERASLLRAAAPLIKLSEPPES